MPTLLLTDTMSVQANRKMCVAITGGSGQLGTEVIRRLIDDRHVERIIAIDLRSPSHVSSKIEIVTADIRDPEIGQHFYGCDVLIHLAFIVTEYHQREVFDAVNVEGSKNVFKAAARSGVDQIIYTSSLAAYGVCPGHPDPIIEDTPRKLVDSFPYSAAKYRVEAYLDDFEAQYPNIKVVRMRPAIMLGTNAQTTLLRMYLRSLDRGYLLALDDIPISLVWDEDVAEAITSALCHGAHGAFNLSADDPMTPQEIARATGLRPLGRSRIARKAVTTIASATARFGYGARIDPAWANTYVPMRQDCTKAKKVLGWKPNHRTTVDVVSHYREVANCKMDRRITTFMWLNALAMKTRPCDPQVAAMLSVFHLKITGRGGGDFTIVVKNRRLNLTKGIPRPPTSVATLSAKTFLDLVCGRDNYETAQITGKIRLEGDASAELILTRLVSRFRMASKSTGLRGLAIRLVARWFAQGGKT